MRTKIVMEKLIDIEKVSEILNDPNKRLEWDKNLAKMEITDNDDSDSQIMH